MPRIRWRLSGTPFRGPGSVSGRIAGSSGLAGAGAGTGGDGGVESLGDLFGRSRRKLDSDLDILDRLRFLPGRRLLPIRPGRRLPCLAGGLSLGRRGAPMLLDIARRGATVSAAIGSGAGGSSSYGGEAEAADDIPRPADAALPIPAAP